MSRYPTIESSVQLMGGDLVLTTRYDAALVSALKARIPAHERKFDGQRKAWLVSPKHGRLLSDLVAQYLGDSVSIPVATAKQNDDLRVLDIRYVGATKPRDGYDERVAFGWSGGEWSVIFPESTLKLWFTGIATQSQSEAITLYGVLGVNRAATTDEIKTAFRRLARQWHPDVCREPDAKEMFIKIKNAYDVLSTKRERYDAGLALEASLSQSRDWEAIYQDQYRSPLRCGYVLAMGSESVGRFLVKEIQQWEDITYGDRVLSTSWPMGAKAPVEDWI